LRKKKNIECERAKGGEIKEPGKGSYPAKKDSPEKGGMRGGLLTALPKRAACLKKGGIEL